MSRDALCFSCLFVDERPELGFNGQLVYCMKKEKVVTPKTSCDLFVRSTQAGRDEMRTRIYGVLSGEETGEE